MPPSGPQVERPPQAVRQGIGEVDDDERAVDVVHRGPDGAPARRQRPLAGAAGRLEVADDGADQGVEVIAVVAARGAGASRQPG